MYVDIQETSPDVKISSPSFIPSLQLCGSDFPWLAPHMWLKNVKSAAAELSWCQTPAVSLVRDLGV